MIPNFTVSSTNDTPSYDFEGMEISREHLERFVHQMNDHLSEAWSSEMVSLKKILDQKESSIRDDLDPLRLEFQKLQELVSRNAQVKQIDSKVTEERSKLNTIVGMEKTKKDNEDKAAALKQRILDSRQAIKKEYDDFAELFRAVTISSDTNLKFDVEIIADGKMFSDAIDGLFDKKKLRPFKVSYGYALSEQLEITDKLFEDIWNAIMDGTLTFKGGNKLQSALELLFSDWFHVHYIVKRDNDTINHMSPGKKALVLLELIVNLDENNCPLLIDQPEDDLDNRSIYNELVQYLRKKKHDRQIIVVTHNANVVIGADAEEVIIANQNGDGARNHSNRFEYRCGAIENISPIYDEAGEVLSGILNQKGIQEQICDILEGGKEAFGLRRRKYLSVN